MKKKPTRFGIRTRFVLTISALIALACLTLTVFFVHHERKRTTEILADQGVSLARNLAVEVQMAAMDSNPESLQPLVAEFVGKEEAIYCAIKDGQGRILAEATDGDFLPEPTQIVTFSHGISRSRTTESGVTEPIWTAWIGLPKSEWTRGLVSLRRSAALLTFSVVAVGVLATLLVVQATLKPIRVLLDATRRIARGQLDKPVQVLSTGEIRDLSEALNEMAFRLQQSHSKLEEYSRTLERKVEDRTQELEERVDELSESRMATLNILEDVKEAKTELERVNEELRALDEMKSKFIGTISHELKTPFTAIKANIDFILSGKEGEVPDHLNQHLLTVQRNTNRVRKIMEDFLTVAQIHSGRRHLEPEDLKLGTVVQECLAEIGPIDQKFQVKAHIPDSISVFADPNRLHDVYINLLLNALRFSPRGGEIRISARPDSAQILSEVSDQGVGIPKDKLEDIFEEFFQIDRKKYGGTGLGLSIVKAIIQEHSGRIWVDSRPGEGSTFFFTLPACKETDNEAIRRSGEDSDR
jgi:signal transduction histidine kinase